MNSATENTDKGNRKDNFFNNVVLIGRAGSEPEIKYFDSGNAKANVSIAVNRFKGKGAQPETDWFRVDFWGKDAETAAEYIKKGTLVSVEGRVSLNSWTDQASGEKREMYSISASSFRLLTSKKEAAEMA